MHWNRVQIGVDVTSSKADVPRNKAGVHDNLKEKHRLIETPSSIEVKIGVAYFKGLSLAVTSNTVRGELLDLIEVDSSPIRGHFCIKSGGGYRNDAGTINKSVA